MSGGSVMATVRAVSRNSVPRPPRKAPISLTQSAIQRLSQLHQSHRISASSSGNALGFNGSLTGASTGGGEEVGTQSARTPHNINDHNKTNGNYIKIAVKTKGCSGNAYMLDWTSEKKALDEEVPVSTNLSLLIDSKALLTILGSQMDFVDEPLQSGFVFNNPNVKETCGCGMSFIV